MSIENHLKDIDFRTKEARQKSALEDFKSWYEKLYEYLETHNSDERILGQLTMLSSVLWYLLPTKEYKKLIKVTKQTKAKL